jgi:hypothetical protein
MANHKYLYKSCRHQNKELREYIVGKMILNMLHTLIEQMILPLKDALNLIKRFKAKRPYHGKKHSVMQAEKKVTVENSLHI